MNTDLFVWNEVGEYILRNLWIYYSDVTLSVEEDGQNIAFAKQPLVVQRSNVHPISTVENLMSSEAVSKRSSLITRTNQMISENTTPSTRHFFVSDVTSSNTQDPETIGNDFTSISTKGHVTLIDDVTSANSHGHAIQTTKFPGTAVGTGGTTHATRRTDISPPAFSKVSFIDRCDRRVRCSVRRSLWNIIWHPSPSPLKQLIASSLRFCIIVSLVRVW